MKSLACAIAITTQVAGAMPASAQTFPTRNLTMLVPYVPGGPTDAAARVVGEHMAATLGEHVLIENVSGGSGLNATAPVRNIAFARELGHALNRPARLRAPAALLHRLAGALADELLIGGQKVLPAKAEDSGFQFRHATLASAFGAMLGAPRGRISEA